MKNYCYNRLQAVELMLENEVLSPVLKLRLYTKRNILKHLIDYETYRHFMDIDALDKYIEDSADIVCGFYED